MKEFDALKDLIRLRRPNEPTNPRSVVIDNFIFRCHYRFTSALLLTMTALASSRYFVSNNINCTVQEDIQKAVETYCFFRSSFLYAPDSSTALGGEWIYPGVGPSKPGSQKNYYPYYQWVPYVLFFQALTFYAPHFFWKNLEGSRIKAFVSRFQFGKEVDGSNSRLISKDRLVAHRDWAKWLVSCELAAGFVLMFNIWLTHIFLKRQFLGLGFTWMFDRQEALDFLFPKITKCSFFKTGPSGSIQEFDVLCVMGLNYIYEKIYCILWFWFSGLVLLQFVGLVWRTMGWALHSRSYLYNRVIWDFISARHIQLESVKFLSEALCFSDWLLLYYIGRNLDGRTFSLIVKGLREEYGYPVEKTSQSVSDSETQYL